MASTCIYCGRRSGATRDHVPPKNLFPSPRPINTVTVPCCRQCQERYKKDEDVFRAWIAFGPAGTTEPGKLLWEQKLKRTYEKDRGLKKIVARSFKRVSFETPGGIHVGEGLVVSIDPERRNSVIKKIVRGLFWFEYKLRLPEEAEIDIFGISGKDESIHEWISITQEATRAWENIFEYRHRRTPDSFESWWIMSFYRQNYFVALVEGPKDVA